LATATTTAYPITRGGRSTGSSPASTVFDGDPGTFWITTTNATPRRAHVYVDLRSVKSISIVRCRFARSDTADAANVEISRDKRTWQTIGTFSNPPAGKWLKLPVDAPGRYVRFSFTNPNRDPKIGGLAEVEVRG
jgi:hypothetical protein